MVFVLVGPGLQGFGRAVHMWTPDVHEGSPTPVTAFFSDGARRSRRWRCSCAPWSEPFGHLLIAWQQLIVVISIASMVLGALAAIGQTNIKRLMAYSSIGHVGYALIGLAVGTPEGIRGVLVYMIVYVIMTVGTFACIMAMRRRGRAVEQIADLARSCPATDPALALAFAVFMFSMAGIPPLSGFFGKLYVFPGGGARRDVDARGHRRADQRDRRLLLHAHRQGDVFRRRRKPSFARPASLSFVAAVTGLLPLLFFVFPGPFVGAAKAVAKAPVRMRGGGPCCWSSIPATPTSSWRCMTMRGMARHMAHPHRRAAHLRRVLPSG